MNHVVQAVLRSWSIPPAATLVLVLTALTYLRGAWLLRRAGYPYLPAWRIGSFALGLFTLWFALASPLDTFSPFVLTAHMLQHMALMMVAPPLILLGEPLIPIVRGMPRFAAREFAGPFLNWPLAARIGLALTNPVTALVLMGVVMFAWHVPGPYELALRSSAWHNAEHSCFFFTSIIFWWPVVQPWPSHPQWPRWAMVPYLVIADLQNTVLSAILVFSDKILYPSYAAGPSLFGFTPQEDQAAAGAIMWVFGSVAFIVPAILIAVQCLSRQRAEYVAPSPPQPEPSIAGPLPLPATQRTPLSSLFGVRASSRSFEVASFLALFVLVAVAFAVFSRNSSDDDDQVLRLAQPSGSFAIAIYGPAGEMPAGPASFAVLVQDRSTHETLLDSDVQLFLRNANGTDGASGPVHALRDDENKLLATADLDIDVPGSRVVEINVHRGSESAVLKMPVEVVKADSAVTLPWSDIVILAFAGLLCVTYFWRHRSRASARLVAPMA